MNQEQINEKLDASAPAKDWIEDFVKSDDPKFDGKTKDERIMMALGAYYAAQKNESVKLEEDFNAAAESLHTKYKFLRRQADEAEEKYQKAKERKLDDDALEPYYTAVRNFNDKADDAYDAYKAAKDKASKNESVELEEAVDFRDMKNASLKQWIKRNDTDDSVSGVFGAQILAAKKEAKRRGINLEKNESVEIEEIQENMNTATITKITGSQIEKYLSNQDFKAIEQICKLMTKDELKTWSSNGYEGRTFELLMKSRKKNEGSVSLNFDREGGIPVTEGKTTDCAIDDLEDAIEDQEEKKKKEKAEGEGTCKTEALDPVGKEDDDVDNDGDSDESDEYLKNRRKTVTKAIQKEEVEDLEEGVEEIKARVAKYSVGDKTNFGVIKSISSTSIEFKSKDLPVTKIAFNQRKMGSKDFVLDRLSRMNESFTEARDLKIAQLALRSDGSGKLEDFVKNYSVVGKSILQIKEEYATFLKANKKQEEEGIQNYP